MEFILQQGYGMMDLARELIANASASGIILTPRVHEPHRLYRYSEELRDLGVDLLFDPQFYQPHTTREKLLKYPYWKDLDFDTATFNERDASSFCERCIDYQLNVLGVSKVITPGRYSNSGDEAWLEMHNAFAQSAHSLDLGIPIYSTVALGPDAILSDDSFNNVLDEVTGYPVDGVYFVFKHPGADFLIRDERVLYNLLNGLLSIRLSGKDVIVGYANQQSLIFAAAGVKTIASGNFRNTRCFDPEDEGRRVRQRATWYYDPNTLSEFRLAFLSSAFRLGFQNRFRPPCPYCAPLFGSGDPASARWRETRAFGHFLYELGRQWLGFDPESADSVVADVISLMETASSNLDHLQSRLHLGERAFDTCIQPTLAALRDFQTDRSADIRRL